ITKPFTQAALAEKLRGIIDAKRVPGRILLVEDEALIQMLATEYLEDAGFTVDATASATEAMNKLGLVASGIDAAIVDLGLPDRSGDILVAEMRAIHPSLPIILATGQTSGEVNALFKDDSRIAYVAKPYTSQNLLEALRRVGIVGSAKQ